MGDLLILASASPRRSAILRQIGVDFEIFPANCDENLEGVASQEEAPRRLAECKAIDVSKRFPQRLVVGFDTLVFLDEQILGKPVDEADAWRMLSALRGRWHQVRTGYCFARSGEILIAGQETTEVCFRIFSQEELACYIASGEPYDKAGGYGIQGLGARLVREIRGCFYNVVGLPVSATLEALERCQRM